MEFVSRLQLWALASASLRSLRLSNTLGFRSHHLHTSFCTTTHLGFQVPPLTHKFLLQEGEELPCFRKRMVHRPHRPTLATCLQRPTLRLKAVTVAVLTAWR